MDWIIGQCNTSLDGISFFRFSGTKEEVKQKLVDLIAADKKLYKDDWEFGCGEVEDIKEEYGECYGYGCYHDFHIDYTATPLENIIVL